MEDLINQKCVPHDKMKILLQEEIAEYLSQLDDRWETMENPPMMIRARYKFADFAEAMKFVNKVADVAEQEEHHPGITINYNKVEIVLWSHFVHGLSINDFIMAAKIDNL